MQYHAHALAVNGVDVDFVGYEGAALPGFLATDPRVAVHRFAEARLRFRFRSSLLYAIGAVVDGARLSVRLAMTLLRLPTFDLLLVQNPPALPTLPVVWFVARVRHARLVIDWHNLGYTMLALRLGRR
ncbi:MAG: hypothetical protein ACHQO8_09330, partial [Vicinamibacterales bacterium]